MSTSNGRDYGFSKCKNHRKKGLCGYDDGKKVKGRKRHILIDTLGFVLSLIVLPADISDRKGAFYLLEGRQSFLPYLSYIYADGG
ncbi:transposase [Candidatus Paracaedibacter symbiosus]|uniref:transposase n=1 Tax=Candidatus Paracaedibacter symbiosus TaxID=244582 RepID=UPI00068AAE82|nr:transposase [Candidatus Paracaedibacter symbiosus]